MALDSSKTKSWQCPRYGSNPTNVLSWARGQVDDGRAYQKAEPGYQDLERTIRVLSGEPDDKLAAKQKDGRYSTLRTNRLKRNIREMVNSLSDIIWTPGFHSDSNDTQAQAETLNRVAYAWYVDRFIDVEIKKGVQWAAISPRGYLEIGYQNIPGERGKSEICVTPRSFAEVLISGQRPGGTIQEAYAVTIIKDLPMYLAHATWPDFQDKITPDRETPLGFVERLKDVGNSVFGQTQQASTARNPTARFYYQYVLDTDINRTNVPIKMGYAKDGSETPWSYTVPPLGGNISAGYDSNGTPTFRRATFDDARKFPNRRLLVFTDNDLLYDGPAFDWHGKVPLVPLSSDSWPFGSFSMVHDVLPMHDTINEIERMTHQTVRNRFNPSMQYDFRAIGRDKAKAIRPDLGGQKIGYNGQQSGDAIKPLLPIQYQTVDGWIQDFKKVLEMEMDRELGVSDFSAMAQMKVGAASDTMEKLLELAGPIVKGISRDMERSMRDLAEMFKYLVFQYYTTPKIMQVVGVDGVTPVNFDFDPGSLVPSHLAGEQKDKPSTFSRRERAMWAADHLKFMVVPNTMHSITQTSKKLMLMQLWRGGFPIDPWTIADVMQVPNFGKKPEGTNDVLSRYVSYETQKSEFALAQQVHAAQVMQNATGATSLDELARKIAEAGNDPSVGLGTPPDGMGPGGGFKGHSGRAPTAQTSPRTAVKGDGRPYIRESN